MNVDFSDGLDTSEREIIRQAKDLILESCTVSEGKYDLSSVNSSELGVSKELFGYIQINSAYLNMKIDEGIYKLDGKMIVPACDEESHLKSFTSVMEQYFVVAPIKKYSGDLDPVCGGFGGDAYGGSRGGNSMNGGNFTPHFVEKGWWQKVSVGEAHGMWQYKTEGNVEYKWTPNNKEPFEYEKGMKVLYYSKEDAEGGTSISSPKPRPLPKVDEDKSFKNTKADCLKEQLEAGGSSSILNILLSGFKLDKSNIDIMYVVKDKVISTETKNEINGKCTPPIKQTNGRLKITIEISQDRMNSQSFLETARTLLHETFHAHLFGMNVDQDLYNSFGEIDFNDTWEKYKLTHPNETQHNWMADNYIKYMKEGLEKLYNNWDEAKRNQFENYVNDIRDENNAVYGNDRDWMFTCLAWQGLLGKDHNKTKEGATFYKENRAKYNTTHRDIISMLTKDCPFKK
ncbi:hypothetical protein [Labilibaculum euxinus]